MILLTDQEFVQLRDYVLSNYGIDLSKKRILIQGRLTSVLQSYGLDNFTDYINRVRNDKSGTELQILLNKLTTNLTFFMREKEHFDFLTHVALPEFDQIFKGRELRIWSAGCSSGEEAYTIAMTIKEYCEQKRIDRKFVILGSDISQNVLARAQRAVYPETALKDLPPAWIPKYFEKVGDGDYKVKDSITKHVTFRTFNLMDTFRFAKPFELIFCRNVMIYFEKQKKDNLITNFYKWLTPGGYFFISHSENIGRSDTGFRMVKPSTFRRDS